MPKVINIPRTTTLLAMAITGAAIWSGKVDWDTAVMMILTFYFTKEQQKRD